MLEFYIMTDIKSKTKSEIVNNTLDSGQNLFEPGTLNPELKKKVKDK